MRRKSKCVAGVLAAVLMHATADPSVNRWRVAGGKPAWAETVTVPGDCGSDRNMTYPDCVVTGGTADMIDVRSKGAIGDGKSDDTRALQAAFDDASRTGRDVWLPAADYRYTDQLEINGVRVRGSGPGTRLLAGDPARQRILMTGNAPALACLQILYHDLERNGRDHGRKGVMVKAAKNFLVQDIHFNGQAYGSIPRFGGGALFVYRSSNGQILNNHLVYAAADSIHITGGSTSIIVKGNLIEYSGDDGIAVVNYGKAVRNNVLIQDNIILNNRWGRNISAVGGQDIQILNNYVEGNSADGAGVYIASEPAYDTAAPEDILIQDNMIQATGGPAKGHGQIMLWTGNENSVGNVVVRSNTIRSSKRRDLAIVVSNRVNNVVLESNRTDGVTSLRGGASIHETNGSAVSNDATTDDAGRYGPRTGESSGRCAG